MCGGLLKRLIGSARRDATLPLLRLGQGSYGHDVFPEDIGMTSATKTPAQIDLGFLVREPADVYHARAKDFLSAHALNEFRRCPLLYRKKEMGLVPAHDTTAYLVGRAAHTLILEGRQRYEREYAVGGPINPKTRQPFGSQTKAFAPKVLDQAQSENAEAMADLRRCRETGDWFTRFESLRLIDRL